MKIGIILDHNTLALWQMEALRGLGPDTEFVVYSCTNSGYEKRRSRLAFYYLLNLFTIRNAQTRRVRVPGELKVTKFTRFQSVIVGAWESLPDGLLSHILKDEVAVLVKFGMGLLRVPPAERLAAPILSYHHGNPAMFRGRPAGFYELLKGEPTVGQVVQLLSDDLDSGKIAAAAETKVICHSYRATLVEAYRHSPLLLGRAIDNALRGLARGLTERGPSYRLPSNGVVFVFLLNLVQRKVSRLCYGLFKQKKWNVATSPVPDDAALDGFLEAARLKEGWSVVPTPSGYRFLADPFFHPTEGVLVEALCSESSRGEVLHIAGDTCRRLSGRGGHFSYPATFEVSGSWYVVPEISDWADPLAFPLGGDRMGEPIVLRIPGEPRLLDPTPFCKDGRLYLFGNVVAEGASVLRLWSAPGLQEPFVEHPASPILISPNGARMAGSLMLLGGRLFRAGQDFRRAYGDGVSLFEVTRIDHATYVEEPAGEFRFSHVRGPHTLNVSSRQMAFDYYWDEFFPLAGFRRIRDRLAARRVTG